MRWPRLRAGAQRQSQLHDLALDAGPLSRYPAPQNRWPPARLSPLAALPCAPPIEIERVSDAQGVRPLSLTICVAPPHHHTQSERRRREKTNAPEIRHTRIRSYVRAYHERSRLTSHQEIWQGDLMLARSGVSPPRLFLSGVAWGALHSSGDMG